MKHSVWSTAIEKSADPRRARHSFELLSATSAGPNLSNITIEGAEALAALCSGSEVLSTLVLRHPEYLALLQPEVLRFARQKQGLQRELNSRLAAFLESS